MIRTVLLLGLLACVAACGDGQPLLPEDPDGTPTPPPGPEVPPGTENPTVSASINRYKERDGQGGGYAESVSYDAGTDTFTVDNLAFDGENSTGARTAASSRRTSRAASSKVMIFAGSGWSGSWPSRTAFQF